MEPVSGGHAEGNVTALWRQCLADGRRVGAKSVGQPGDVERASFDSVAHHVLHLTELVTATLAAAPMTPLLARDRRGG